MTALLRNNYQVHCLVRETSSLQYLPRDQVELVYGDLEDSASLEKAVAGVDYIFHLAGRVKGAERRDFFRTNREGTARLLRAAGKKRKSPCSFIYLSSQAAAGPSPDGHPLRESDPARPVSYYGESKLAAEEEVLKSADRFRAVIIRPAVVYGPREKEIFQVIHLIKKGFRFRLGCGDTWLSLVHVSDLVQAILKGAARAEREVQTYFISDGAIYSWSRFIQVAARIMGRKSLAVTIPWRPAYLLFQVLSSLAPSSEAAIYLDKLREMKYKYWVCSPEKAKTELEFIPQLDLLQGMRQTINWYREEGWM